jgi:hypothetical protein
MQEKQPFCKRPVFPGREHEDMGKRPPLDGLPFRSAATLFATMGQTPANRLRGVLGFVKNSGRMTRAPLWFRAKLTRFLQAFALVHAEGWIEEGVAPAALPSPRVLDAIHRDLQRGVAALLESRPWPLPGRLTAILTPEHGILLHGDFRARVVHAIAQQLIAHRGHIRRCKECRTVFYGLKRAEFCQVSCGQRRRDRAKREKRAQRRRP